METVTLSVKGMSCQGCVRSVKNVLEPIPGVTQVEVSLEKGEATVRYDAGKAAVDQFRTAIAGAGFEVA
ncbi:MAG TPA: heavy-metal-associated domain-containing protein [Burkholderiales bacterium]|nr:heavy-metal-associated domain-containing protein [Burkholderiales bacterium]